jgi:hypothetical protein
MNHLGDVVEWVEAIVHKSDDLVEQNAAHSVGGNPTLEEQ